MGQSQSRTGVRTVDAVLYAGVAALALALSAWLGLRGHNWTDWDYEARPSVDALLAGHPGRFLRLAPAYGGSLVLRAPAFELTHLWHGGGVAVYRAGAVPALLAAVALGVYLAGDLRRRGATRIVQLTAIVLCVANPLSIITVQQGHPEDLLGGVLCAAAVLAARREHAVLSGVLAGLATANEPWGVLAAGPVLIALSQHRLRALLAMGLAGGAILAPLVLVGAGGYVAQSRAVGLGTGTIFSPWQLWWFLEPVRAVHPWISRLGHTLPLAIMGPIVVGYALRTRHAPATRRDGAMLVLALLLLLRCVLDPWDTVYYPLPFLLGLIAWETSVTERVPLVALLACSVTWCLFDGVAHLVGDDVNAWAALFTGVSLVTLAAIVSRLMMLPGWAHAPTGGRRRRRPTRAAFGSGSSRTSDRGDLFLFRDAEGGAAAAGGDHVGILDLETGALEAIDEIDDRPLDVGQARGIDEQPNSLLLKDGVSVTLLVERERVLKT